MPSRKTNQHRVIRIGNINSRPGTKTSGYLNVADKAASSIALPVTIVQGQSSGPTLVVIAGEHGCEYCGIMAAVRLIASVTPEKIKGTLIVVPLANPPAFEERTLFVNPIDAVNLYASYPGSLAGTVSHIMAHEIFSQIAKKADFLVHLHGGGHNEAPEPFNHHAPTGKRSVGSKSVKLRRWFPAHYV